jgi:superfamily II DNA or RNA helicase
MTKLVIHNNYCQIQGETDISFLWALDRELSFYVLGAQYMPAYRGYVNREGRFVKWDGKQKLLTESLQFPLGLLERVVNFYKKDSKEVEIEDTRPTKSEAKYVNIVDKLVAAGKAPYPYQLDAVKATQEHECGIIRLATGGGKTIVAALITANFGKNTMIYVIGKDLLYQIHNLFTSLFDQKIGIVGDGLCEIHDINVVSIWTVGQALGLKKSKIIEEDVDDEKSLDPQKYQDIRDMMSRAKVHIFDECHVAACKTIQEIARSISPEHIYGMSASPWRDDGADMLIESLLGRNIINISASTLIKNGYLVKPTIKFLKVPGIPDNKEHFQTVYKKYIVENEVRNSYVIKGAEKLVEQGYQTLVLYNSVAHGAALFEELNKKLPCYLLSGKDSSDVRTKAKHDLEDGKIKCIIASKIFDIGVDLPSLSGLVIASSGKSSVRALQRIGRVIRKYPNKSRAAIIDFYDQAPFLKDHAKARKKIYSSEEEFQVIWPK